MPKQKSLLELQLYEESDFSIIWSSDDDDDDYDEYDDYDYDNYRYHSQQRIIVDNSLINNHSQQPMIVDNSLIICSRMKIVLTLLLCWKYGSLGTLPKDMIKEIIGYVTPLTLGERKDNEEKQKSIQYQNSSIYRRNFAILPHIKSRNKKH